MVWSFKGREGNGVELSSVHGCLGLSAGWDAPLFQRGLQEVSVTELVPDVLGDAFLTALVLQTLLDTLSVLLYLPFFWLVLLLASAPIQDAFLCLNFQKRYRVKFPLNFLCWSFGPVLQFHQGQNKP